MPDGPVPLSDLEIANRIVRAATTGPPGDREPTVRQLMAAFDEPQATPDARRRVAAALEMAGARIEPSLLTTPDDERVRIAAPGGRRGRSLSPAMRAGIGAAALVGLIVVVKLGASLGGGGSGPTAGDSLPATATTGRAQTTTRPVRTTPATATATTTAPQTTTTPAAAADKTVTVRLVPAHASFVCVDDGHGTILFHGQLKRSKHFTGNHIRVSIAHPKRVRMVVNDKTLTITHTPAGYDIGVHHVLFLPKARRPCGGRTR